ncbi:MAG: LLM class flavin-dependent oxidoreductase [Myxococcota bacterium]
MTAEAPRSHAVSTAPASAACPVLYATIPHYQGQDPGGYLGHVARVARWSEEAGCEGALVYTDNSLLDPWLVAQAVMQATERLVPLVAVQPIYMHPYAVAKKIATLSYLHERRVDLNMVAGGFKTDLVALCDETPHDRRYDRLVEYTEIVKRLCAGGPVCFEGDFHRVKNVKLSPPVPAELQPRILLSGSSEAGLAAARALSALPVCYPEPAKDFVAARGADGCFGMRVGIVAREEEDSAWEVATTRFPEDRAGQLKHQLAMKVSDSSWHQQLSALAKEHTRDTYWMVPFTNYKTFCPYLVGSHDCVGSELARYFAQGCSAMILDVPVGTEDMGHVIRTIRRGAELAAAA